jgi:hypothetical protein
MGLSTDLRAAALKLEENLDRIGEVALPNPFAIRRSPRRTTPTASPPIFRSSLSRSTNFSKSMLLIHCRNCSSTVLLIDHDF